MKIGDLVQWTKAKLLTRVGPCKDIGVVTGFDKDNDPIILWQLRGAEDIGTYRSQIEVIDESRGFSNRTGQSCASCIGT